MRIRSASTIRRASARSAARRTKPKRLSRSRSESVMFSRTARPSTSPAACGPPAPARSRAGSLREASGSGPAGPRSRSRRGRLVGAEDRARDLRAARANQPGQADDLARRTLKRTSSSTIADGSAPYRCGPARAPRARRRRALGEALQTALGLFRSDSSSVAADHHPDDAVGRCLGDGISPACGRRAGR